MRQVREYKLTYLSDSKLSKLASLCLLNENRQIPGIIVETGCALGGSSIFLAAIKAKNRPLRVYDVFGMIPPPSDKDAQDVYERYDIIRSGKSKGVNGDTYYGYMDNLYEKVINNFKKFGYPIEANNIQLIKGLIQDTLQINEPVSLAHIDVDWYEPVYISLKRIEPWLSVSGAIVLDDYLEWSGCRDAVDKYFMDKKHLFRFDTSAGSMVIIREKNDVFENLGYDKYI